MPAFPLCGEVLKVGECMESHVQKHPYRSAKRGRWREYNRPVLLPPYPWHSCQTQEWRPALGRKSARPWLWICEEKRRRRRCP